MITAFPDRAFEKHNVAAVVNVSCSSFVSQRKIAKGEQQQKALKAQYTILALVLVCDTGFFFLKNKVIDTQGSGDCLIN